MDHGILFIVAVIAVLVSDILLFLLGYFLHRSASRGRGDGGVLSAKTAKDVVVLRQSLLGMVRRLVQLEERFGQIEARQEELRFCDKEGQAYEVAAKLVRKGASVDELVSVCGISRGEAELIINLHDTGSG